jgi:hypothetical protein
MTTRSKKTHRKSRPAQAAPQAGGAAKGALIRAADAPGMTTQAEVLRLGDVSAEERVGLIRNSLDKMEGVQLQFACGAVFIGLELIALREQLRGDFWRVFEERLERPRFSDRTARQYMRAAEKVRVKLLHAGKVDLGDLWDVAPSALPLARRRDLQDAVGTLVNGRCLSQLLLDLDSRGPKRLTAGAPGAGAAAEERAYAEVWTAIRKQLASEGLHRKSWKHLDARGLAALRECLESVLASLPAKI